MNISTYRDWKKLLTKARDGNNISQWEVGYCFENGIKTESESIIIEKNLEKAITWFRLSAQQNNASAQLSLATILSTERDYKNFEEAIFWSKKAIKNGSATAAHTIIWQLFIGIYKSLIYHSSTIKKPLIWGIKIHYWKSWLCLW